MNEFLMLVVLEKGPLDLGALIIFLILNHFESPLKRERSPKKSTVVTAFLCAHTQSLWPISMGLMAVANEKIARRHHVFRSFAQGRRLCIPHAIAQFNNNSLGSLAQTRQVVCFVTCFQFLFVSASLVDTAGEERTHITCLHRRIHAFGFGFPRTLFHAKVQQTLTREEGCEVAIITFSVCHICPTQTVRRCRCSNMQHMQPTACSRILLTLSLVLFCVLFIQNGDAVFEGRRDRATRAAALE